jgi:hypothetical protein
MWRYGGVVLNGHKNLRHQLPHQKFKGPTPSSFFAALRLSQNNLKKLDYRAQSIIDRTTQPQFFLEI